MTWRDVLVRDLRSVYRSRTGTTVAALLALFTVLTVGLFALAEDYFLVAAVGSLVSVGVLVVLTVVGSPRTVAGFVGGFTLVTLALVAVVGGGGEATGGPQFLTVVLGSALSLLVPLVGLLGSYAALVGERSTGSVRFLLGLPNSRDDAYLGKYLSRSVVVLAPLVVGMALTGLIVATTYESGSLRPVVGIGLLSIPYALLFVGLGLTASAYADTEGRAVAMVVAVFALLRAAWPGLQWLGLQRLPFEQRHPEPEWYFWLGRINPINAYVKLTTEFGPGSTHPLITTERGLSTVATTSAFAAAVLLAWGVAAPLAGLWYFRRRDLL